MANLPEYIVTPDYYKIFRCHNKELFIKNEKVLFRECSENKDFSDFKAMYGLTRNQIGWGIYNVNGAQDGYYLANLRKREYYYCGDSIENVVALLQEFGIGAVEPDRKES